MALIAQVKSYGRNERKKVDEKRTSAGAPTRLGTKKAAPVRLTKGEADKLKAQPDTAQGRRDAVLMALLLDHGLRVGEVALLKVENFDLVTGKMTFHRPKVDKVQTHQLTADTWRALSAYFGGIEGLSAYDCRHYWATRARID